MAGADEQAAMPGDSMNKPRTEQREFPRLTVNCAVGCRPASGRGESRTLVKNISGNGVLIVAAEPPALGARMEIIVGPDLCSIPALHALVEVVRIAARASWDYGDEAPQTPCYDIGARIVAMQH